MAKVKVETPRGKIKAAQKQLEAKTRVLEQLPPNASTNVKIEALTAVVLELSKLMLGDVQ